MLLREVRAQGYIGGITQLKDYVNVIRPTEPAEPVVRFETDPGKQLQIDFVDFRRGTNPLRAFTPELSYSRYAYVEFTDNERTETLVACLERALIFFGGAPEHILCDNPKPIVIERNAYAEGRHRYNKYLLDLPKRSIGRSFSGFEDIDGLIGNDLMRPLPYAGRRVTVETALRSSVPIPIESLQHPLAIYEQFAQEISS